MVVATVVVETDNELLAVGVTVPMFWLMENIVAFVVVHESVDESPDVIVVGDAVSVQSGAGGGVTVTVAVHATVPPAPVAVPV